MTEKELQSAVIMTMRGRGWKVAHFHEVPVLRSGKVVWMTPVAADGKGWPDIVAVRERLVVAELKIHPVRLKPEQSEWIAAFEGADVEHYTWTDRDWTAGRIDKVIW